jgi:hypothetical protein
MYTPWRADRPEGRCVDILKQVQARGENNTGSIFVLHQCSFKQRAARKKSLRSLAWQQDSATLILN